MLKKPYLVLSKKFFGINCPYATTTTKSGDNFSKARQTPEHREALLALKDKRKSKFHDVEYMQELAEKVSKGIS